MEASETIEQDENDLYIVEFSRNGLLPDNIDDEQSDNDTIEEIQDNRTIRDRGRGRSRPRGSRGRGHNRNEQNIELLLHLFLTFFNILNLYMNLQ